MYTECNGIYLPSSTATAQPRVPPASPPLPDSCCTSCIAKPSHCVTSACMPVYVSSGKQCQQQTRYTRCQQRMNTHCIVLLQSAIACACNGTLPNVCSVGLSKPLPQHVCWHMPLRVALKRAHAGLPRVKHLMCAC